MAVLREKSKSAKLIDTKKASKKQLHTIKVLPFKSLGQPNKHYIRQP
jgi:hypothetical protein